MPRITVDGRELEVQEGRTLLQALDDLGLLMNGIDVPHYCWHPKLSIDGSCRLCQVEVEGMPKLQIACNTPAKDGMVVRTDTERVERAREGVMELLLVNHPLDCPICDQAGECKLQDYAYEYGVPHARTREPRRALKKAYDLGPTIVFDQERCILCRRCVRFCREIPKTGELGIFDRTDASVVETFPGTPLDNPYSMNVADICPVGALTTKDFRFKIRVWFLEDVPGVCTGCANGCNVWLGVANNKVYRYLPRRNDDVNDTWICDAGRMSYQEIGAASRLGRCLVRGELGVPESAPFPAALDAAAERLRGVLDAHGPGAVGALASPHATNEDLFVFRRLLDAMGVEERGCPVVRGEGDDLLIREEKAANATGARALGFGDPEAVFAALREGRLRGAIVLGHDALHPDHLGGGKALAELEAVVAVDTHQSDLLKVAHVLFPARVAAERHGTVTNFEGRVQRVVPAVEPPFEAYAMGEILFRLGEALRLAGFDGGYDPFRVSAELSRAVPAFEGSDLRGVGDGGRLLRTPGGAPEETRP